MGIELTERAWVWWGGALALAVADTPLHHAAHAGEDPSLSLPRVWMLSERALHRCL